MDLLIFNLTLNTHIFVKIFNCLKVSFKCMMCFDEIKPYSLPSSSCHALPPLSFLVVCVMFLKFLSPFSTAYMCMSVEPLLEHGEPSRSHVLEEDMHPLSQQPSVVNPLQLETGLAPTPPSCSGIIH